MVRLDTTDEAEQVQVEIFRRMKPEARLQAGIVLSQDLRDAHDSVNSTVWEGCHPLKGTSQEKRKLP